MELTRGDMELGPPSIQEAKTIQSALNLTDVHVCWLGTFQFVIAHTDDERARGSSLEECALHEWLWSTAAMPIGLVGYYVATERLDTQNGMRYDFTRLITYVGTHHVALARTLNSDESSNKICGCSGRCGEGADAKGTSGDRDGAS